MSLVTLSPFLYWHTTNHYETIDQKASEFNETWKQIASLFNKSVTSSGCIVIQYDYIPWNNPDNIVSVQTEELVRALKDLFFLPIMFLIGFPGNLINMAVFYKQGLKERINVLLFSLSLADEMYLISNIVCYGEQFHLFFTTKEMFGPVARFMANNLLLAFLGFVFVSQILSAIIASERCFCVMQPLRSQTVLSTSTMTTIIVAVNVILIGLMILDISRYHNVCAFDPIKNSTVITTIPTEFYLRNQQLIEYLDVFVFGVGLPSLSVIVVVVATIITIIKLRQAAEWRAGTSSNNVVSSRDIALTKMLVSNSIFFIICVFPFCVLRFSYFFMPEVNTGRRQHNFYFVVQYILLISSYFNSTFNIVVYYAMGSRYRQTFWQLFGRRTKKA